MRPSFVMEVLTEVLTLRSVISQRVFGVIEVSVIREASSDSDY